MPKMHLPHQRPLRRRRWRTEGVTSIVGKFNLADEYDGDGITHRWRDLALELRVDFPWFREHSVPMIQLSRQADQAGQHEGVVRITRRRWDRGFPLA